MNRKLCPVGIAWLIFIPTILFAQMNWEWQNPLPQGADMFRIISLSQENVTITGSGGTMLSTSNGGQSWYIQRLQNVDWVRKYSFISENDGWIVGNWKDNDTKETISKIFKTNDSGRKFYEILFASPIDYSIYSVDDIEFLSESKGYLIANPPSAMPAEEQSLYPGLIFTTNDGGLHWAQADIGIQRKYNQIIFMDSLKGFLLSQPYYSNYDFDQTLLHYSDDGGTNWTTLDNTGYGQLQFVDDSVGWAGNYRTVNGGQSWEYQESAYPQLESPITRTHFADSLVGYAISDAKVFKTYDAGKSWNIQKEFKTGKLQDIRFSDTEHGYTCGYGGTVFKTDNGGQDWIRSGSGSTENLNDVDFIDAYTGWVVGNGGTILSTDDGGVVWKKQDIPAECLDLDFRGVDFVNSQLGWSICGGYILNTTDGGNYWLKQYVSESTDLERFHDIHFVDEITGYAVGQVNPWPETGIMYKSDNGGVSWSRVMGGNIPILDEISFIDQNRGWISGDGILISTLDAGTSWQSEYFPENLRYIQMLNSDTGWISALNEGAFYRTTDGGEFWRNVPFENRNMQAFNSFFFFNNHQGVATSFLFNNLLTTGDGGRNWTSQERLPLFRINRLWFTEEGPGWAVGNNGSILHFFKSYFNNEKDSIPEMISSGVYPNPFNRETTIYFQNLANAPLDISIYNLLGRLIATFHESTDSNGYNEFLWSPDGISSGVYLINFQSLEYSRTIKAVMIK